MPEKEAQSKEAASVEFQSSGTTFRSDIQPIMHPDAVAAYHTELNVPDTEGAYVLRSAREALRIIHETYSSINDTERMLRAAVPPVPGENPKGDVRQVNDVKTQHVDTTEFVEAALTAYRRVAPHIDKSVKAMQYNEAQLAHRVATAIDDPARKTNEGQSLAKEIRAHVKSLSEKNRFQFVAQKIERGHLQTVAAVIHAPAYLAGLEDKSGATLKTLAEMRFAPIERSQLDATRRAIAHVSAAAAALSRLICRVNNA